MTWLTGGALGFSLLLVGAMLVLIAEKGLGHFWPSPLYLFELRDGSRVLGQIHGREEIPSGSEGSVAPRSRIRVKIGNRDLTGLDFRWIDEEDVVERRLPTDVVLLERLEWGVFFGTPLELRRDGAVLETRGEALWEKLDALLETKGRERGEIRALEQGSIGDVNHEIEQIRLAKRRLELRLGEGAARSPRMDALTARLEAAHLRYDELVSELTRRSRRLLAEVLTVEAVDGTRVEIPVGSVLRAVRPNTLGRTDRLRLYLSRLWEFLSADPRESNTEGGIFPAIFGTVMMVFLMTVIVVPFGVLAAIYLQEYAKEGLLVRTVRIAVNNLAGVPSIVFGMFGLGFFVYLVGGSIDRIFYPEALPTPTYGTGGILWASLTLALLTAPVVIVATEEGLAAVPRVVREGSLALGATRFETLRRVVLPAAAPGILTGLILAMARAAGEVAPLMLVGVVKLAPSLPIDHHFPFLHLERKFMHLGFHIYDVGFQSPNVEAVKPLVFTTALLLIVVVVATNLAAILIRNRLRRKYASSAV